MKLILIIVIITSIALIGSQLTFLSRRLPIGSRHVLMTGTEFIFVGLIFGPGLLNLIDATTMKQLHPFLSFGLGWIGFMFGLQFDRRKVRFLPKNYFTITTIISLVTILIVGIVFWFILGQYRHLSQSIVLVLSMTLAATAACTGQSSMAIVHRDFGVPSRGVMNLFRYIAAVDALFSILVAGYALCYLKVNEDALTIAVHLQAAKWFLISVVIGVIIGYVFHFMTYYKLDQNELLLITIGVVMLASGISLFLELSSLFIPFIMGYIVANRSLRNSRVLEIMIRSEKSVYIMLVILAGAAWDLNLHIHAVLLLLYVIIRAAAKIFGGWLATRLAAPNFPVPARMGLGLLSQGGVSIAILINLQQAYTDPIIHEIFAIVIFAALINELISPTLITRIVEMEHV